MIEKISSALKYISIKRFMDYFIFNNPNAYTTKPDNFLWFIETIGR
jgi:hypothetical protein